LAALWGLTSTCAVFFIIRLGVVALRQAGYGEASAVRDLPEEISDRSMLQ